MRLFMAAEIPEEIKRKIAVFIDSLKRLERNVKWVTPDNIHITLYFFGNVSENYFENLVTSLKGVTSIGKPFDVSIENISAFPSPERPRVIWCGVKDPSGTLKGANGFIKDLVINKYPSLEIENREYTPHLTLGRVKGHYSGRLTDILKREQGRVFGHFTIGRFVLFKSTLTKNGPIYKELEFFEF